MYEKNYFSVISLLLAKAKSNILHRTLFCPTIDVLFAFKKKKKKKKKKKLDRHKQEYQVNWKYPTFRYEFNQLGVFPAQLGILGKNSAVGFHDVFQQQGSIAFRIEESLHILLLLTVDLVAQNKYNCQYQNTLDQFWCHSY